MIEPHSLYPPQKLVYILTMRGIKHDALLRLESTQLTPAIRKDESLMKFFDGVYDGHLPLQKAPVLFVV